MLLQPTPGSSANVALSAPLLPLGCHCNGWLEDSWKLVITPLQLLQRQSLQLVQHGTTLFGKHLVDRGQKEQLFVTVHFGMEIMIVGSDREDSL